MFVRTTSAILALALLCAVFTPPAEARTVNYAPEAICIVANATSHVDSSLHEQIADTPRGPVGYYRFGHGTPIVLVTGYRATISEWDAKFLAALARHHDVIVFDNRGIGRSLPQATSFSVQDMANDTVALIHTLHLERPTVVGWSMGGAIVQRLAIESPALAGKIVLMSTLPPGQYGVPVPREVFVTLSGGKGATFEGIMRVLFPATSVDYAIRCFRQAMFRPADYSSPGIAQNVVDGQSALLDAWADDNDAAHALRSVRTPVLVLSGNEDRVVPDANARALQRLLPHAELLLVNGGGHAMMYQYPLSLARAIDRFIADPPLARNS